MYYFITETYLKSLVPINANVDISLIVPHIDAAQTIYIKKVIVELYGITFYTHLFNAASGSTLSADETTLVEYYVKPALAYRTIEMALPFIDTQITNKGLQNQSGDFSTPADDSRMKYIRNELKNRAESYAELLVEYLDDNKSLFSANIVDSEIDGDQSQARNSFDSGFVLDDDFPNCN